MKNSDTVGATLLVLLFLSIIIGVVVRVITLDTKDECDLMGYTMLHGTPYECHKVEVSK